MANDLNRCEFIGRLGKDPEVRYQPSGDPVTSFSIAVGWKTKDKEGAEWVNIVAFGKLAEICGEYLTKGKQVYIAGRWNTQKWQDKDTGQDRYSTRVIADQMQMLGGREDGAEGDPRQQRAARQRSESRQQNEYADQRGGAHESSGGNDFDSEIPF